MLSFGSSCRTKESGGDHPADEDASLMATSGNAVQGTIRLVGPNDWACVVWTVAGIAQQNGVVADIFRKDPNILSGSRLISIKSSKFFQDYSKDGTTAGKNLNGLWGDCARFAIVSTQPNSEEVQIRTNTYYTAWAADGNGARMVPNKSLRVGCATARDGYVVIDVCKNNDDNQKWLWDKGNNGGYGYIKLAKDSGKCMDVSGGSAGVSPGQPIILYRCKPFVAGPGGISNNQRFWLD